jgi:hypothetical protein
MSAHNIPSKLLNTAASFEEMHAFGRAQAQQQADENTKAAVGSHTEQQIPGSSDKHLNNNLN